MEVNNIAMDICKFKQAGNQKWCRIIWGYCQFYENGFEDGHICPIKAAYPNFYDYIYKTEQDKNGIAAVDNIFTQAAFNEQAGQTVETPSEPDMNSGTIDLQFQ